MPRELFVKTQFFFFAHSQLSQYDSQPQQIFITKASYVKIENAFKTDVQNPNLSSDLKSGDKNEGFFSSNHWNHPNHGLMKCLSDLERNSNVKCPSKSLRCQKILEISQWFRKTLKMSNVSLNHWDVKKF